MRIKKIHLQGFKRFHNLVIDLTDRPSKIIALVGPNGCGKSSVFDAFERKSSQHKGNKINPENTFYSKKMFSADIAEEYNQDRSITIEYEDAHQPLSKKSYLIRSAYRFTGKMNVTSLNQKNDILNDELRPATSTDMDHRLQDNYERLFGQYFSEVQVSELSGKALKEKIIKEVNEILAKVLDIKITSLGNIIEPNQGKLFFEKGTSKNFPYDNLSAGEKEVLDIIMDLVVKSKIYNDTVFCIDEPEIHLNTSVQRKLLIEIAKLIPNNCQLWIATHSVGFLRGLQEELADNCQVLDFDRNFDEQQTIVHPMKKTRANWLRIFKTALEDLTGLIAPTMIVYCEGRLDPGGTGEELGFDAKIYSKIFETELPDTSFVSSGGATQPEQYAEFAILVLGKVLQDITILNLADRDLNHNGALMTDAQRMQWLQATPLRRMLKRRELENYLYDFEVLKKSYPNITENNYNLLVTDIINDDVKAQFPAIRTLCGENNISKKDFTMKLAENFTPDVTIYHDLKACVLNQ